jgi:hypothetical protein
MFFPTMPFLNRDYVTGIIFVSHLKMSYSSKDNMPNQLFTVASTKNAAKPAIFKPTNIK